MKYAEAVHRFYLDLPKKLPTEIVEGSAIYELDFANGSQTLRVIERDDGLLGLRLDTLVADSHGERVEKRMLTPLIDRQTIEVLAEQVLSANQRVMTWQFTAMVLAMGAVIGSRDPRIAEAVLASAVVALPAAAGG